MPLTLRMLPGFIACVGDGWAQYENLADAQQSIATLWKLGYQVTFAKKMGETGRFKRIELIPEWQAGRGTTTKKMGGRTKV